MSVGLSWPVIARNEDEIELSVLLVDAERVCLQDEAGDPTTR
jgi:hypothetical protein